MGVDDDTKETNVSPTAAKTLPTTVLMDAAENSIPLEAAAGSHQVAAGSSSAISEVPGIAADGSPQIEELGALFRNHYKGMFRVAYRITGSESDAEDVLQNVFMRLTPGWEERDLSPNPRGFLYRAAINASLDLLRHRKRLNSVSLDVIDFDQSTKAARTESHLADIELRELIRHAVAKLEGRAATAFVLRYYEGYDNGHIAELLGTSQMVVAVTLHRARTRLRKEIGSYLEKHHEEE